MESKVYKEFKEIEERHWWFVSRREILRSFLSDLFPQKKSRRSLDIGSGPGINLPMIGEFSDNLVCVEPSLDSANEIKEKFRNVEVFHGTFPEVSVEGEFDLITMFDVIEHIDDESSVLSAIKKYLSPNGICVVTVPAYMFLWSEHDDIVHHKRRYTKSQLVEVVERSGFSVLRVSYFNTFLFIPIALVRILKNTFGWGRNNSDFSITPVWANALLRLVFLLEKSFLRYMNFPFGVSIICVFKVAELK